jgi:hypothetical protein
MAVRLRPLAKLGQQPGLADPGRPDQLHRPGLSTIKTRQSAVQHVQLGTATDE